MTRLLVATTNPGKLREIRGILAAAPVALSSLADLPPIVEPEETGASFAENARLKALYYDVRKGTEPMLVVAEDSGLVIDALDGEPGIHSARFLGAEASYPDRFDEISRRLAQRPDRPRSARFVCAVAVVREGAVIYETTATVEGEIADRPKGTAGFGYDPIFYYPPYGMTLAEVTEEEKLRVAHRGKAFAAVADWLRRM